MSACAAFGNGMSNKALGLGQSATIARRQCGSGDRPSPDPFVVAAVLVAVAWLQREKPRNSLSLQRLCPQMCHLPHALAVRQRG